MKLDNKGFAISTIMYIILTLGVIIIITTLSVLSSRKLILEKQKQKALENVYDNTYVENTQPPTEDKIEPNIPKLSGLTPVIYKDNAWVIADISKKWYDYENYEWANAVILTDEGKKKQTNQALDLDTDVRAMFVWIPRYEYKIGTKEQEISVNFISGKGTNATEGYTVHPAFKFGDDELTGIWVGKFETSADKTSTCYTSPNADNCNNTEQDPYILPNVSSLRWQTIINQFATAQKFNTLLTNADSHMMKNREWGAVAYLSQSKYGKYGKDKEEVYINNCSNFITGIAGNSVSDVESATTCTTNTYNTDKGQKASTTGTIYGIYDMSGGAWDRVMGNYNNTVASSGFDATWFTLADNTKYYDKYSVTSTSSCTDEECKGHALKETPEWYGDYARFVESNGSWFGRGGGYNNGTSAGVFDFYSSIGDSSDYYSFRVVLAPTK